jgi:hypothetical protein
MKKSQANPFGSIGNMAETLTNLSTDKEHLFRAASNHGYVIAPQKVLRCFRLSEIEKTVLLDIASMTGDRGYAFYSHNYLSFRLGKKSATTIKNALKSLRSKNFIYWALGGGDLGTNSYRIENLFDNPYLILSEAVHYFADKLLYSFRNQIPYTKIYGSILHFVEQPMNIRNSERDIYGQFVGHLEKNPHERDCLELYMNLFARLFKSLWKHSKVYIHPDWQQSFQEIFSNHFYKHVTSEPRFTLSLSDFSATDYKDFKFPIEISLFGEEKSGVDRSKSPELMLQGRNLIKEVERTIETMGQDQIIEECRKREIPTNYEEALEYHFLNGGDGDEMVSYRPCKDALEEALLEEGYEKIYNGFFNE